MLIFFLKHLQLNLRFHSVFFSKPGKPWAFTGSKDAKFRLAIEYSLDLKNSSHSCFLLSTLRAKVVQWTSCMFCPLSRVKRRKGECNACQEVLSCTTIERFDFSTNTKMSSILMSCSRLLARASPVTGVIRHFGRSNLLRASNEGRHTKFASSVIASSIYC